MLNAGYLLDIELSALQTEGRGEVISNPRVVTSNQKEAVIRQGQEVGYVTLTGGGTTGAALPSVQFKDVLLELKVTPTITNDGRVFLAMNVKKDEIEGFINTSIGDVPQIAKREVNTAVLIEDGQTVVIGGVYEFKSTQRRLQGAVPRRHSVPGQPVQEEGPHQGKGGAADLRDAEGAAGRTTQLSADHPGESDDGGHWPPFVFAGRALPLTECMTSAPEQTGPAQVKLRLTRSGVAASSSPDGQPQPARRRPIA